MKHLFFALLTLFSAFFVGCGEHTFDTLGLSGDCKGIKCEDSSSSVNRQSSSSINGQSSSSGYANNNNCSSGSPYRTVTIGTQTWMAENLNCDVTGSVCYDNDPANCAKYGRLYNWETALTVCPNGWHLPTRAEWHELLSHVGVYLSSWGNSYENAGKSLKASSGWRNGNGDDSFGFTALPGGKFYTPSLGFTEGGSYGYWWTATEMTYASVHNIYIGHDFPNALVTSDDKSFSNSVRCLKD